MPTYKHHVFLSYSRKDLAIMRRIRDELQTEGILVWTDEGIEPGTPLWKDSIEDAIETAGCLIAILSPHAKKSIWVKREIDYAETQEKRTFPVLAKGNKNNAIPFALTGTQYVDITADTLIGIRTLIKAIQSHLGISTVFPVSRDIESSQYTVHEVREFGNELISLSLQKKIISYSEILALLKNFAEGKIKRKELVSSAVANLSSQTSVTYVDILEIFPEAERDIGLLDELVDQLYKKGIRVNTSAQEDETEDELYVEAVEMVRRLNRASVSLLQRRLRIGYTRASQLIDRMKLEGIVRLSDGATSIYEVLPQHRA